MQMADPYILVADDDPEDRQALRDEFRLQNPGIAVKEVEGGRELLDFLDRCLPRQLPAVIVLDYQMPDLSGPEVLQQLSADERYRQIMIVTWSTSSRTKDMEECKRLGAMDYLIKPDCIDGLNKSVRQLAMLFEMATRRILPQKCRTDAFPL